MYHPKIYNGASPFIYGTQIPVLNQGFENLGQSVINQYDKQICIYADTNRGTFGDGMAGPLYSFTLTWITENTHVV